MRRLAVAAALLAAAACTGRRAADLNTAFAQAQETLRLGDTSAALRQTDDSLGRVGSEDDSEAAWRLRLLRAEIFITRRDLPSAEALLSKPVPDVARLATVRARRRYLDARVAMVSNDLPRVIEISAEARGLAPDDPDLQIRRPSRPRHGRLLRADPGRNPSVRSPMVSGQRSL